MHVRDLSWFIMYFFFWVRQLIQQLGSFFCAGTNIVGLEPNCDPQSQPGKMGVLLAPLWSNWWFHSLLKASSIWSILCMQLRHVGTYIFCQWQSAHGLVKAFFQWLVLRSINEFWSSSLTGTNCSSLWGKPQQKVKISAPQWPRAMEQRRIRDSALFKVLNPWEVFFSRTSSRCMQLICRTNMQWLRSCG